MTTGTLKGKLQTGTPGHRDTGNINDDRDAQREITDWDTGTQMTTGIL